MAAVISCGGGNGAKNSELTSTNTGGSVDTELATWGLRREPAIDKAAPPENSPGAPL